MLGRGVPMLWSVCRVIPEVFSGARIEACTVWGGGRHWWQMKPRRVFRNLFWTNITRIGDRLDDLHFSLTSGIYFGTVFVVVVRLPLFVLVFYLFIFVCFSFLSLNPLAVKCKLYSVIIMNYNFFFSKVSKCGRDSLTHKSMPPLPHLFPVNMDVVRPPGPSGL